ncbi:MAG: PHP domain-containing protein [Clostridia bacterium]|nr:PHP domain-containing protein [Clostridia bacterium]
MKLTADYHTHTTFSHGKGSVLANAEVARDIGLKELGISDHGFSHPAFGLRRRKLTDYSCDCKRAEESTGVKVLRGIESNIISSDGKCDLTEKFYDNFDLFMAGMHQFVTYDFKTYFGFFVPDFFTSAFNLKPSASLVKTNTETFINVIKKCPVDVITHLNFKCFTDVTEVAKAAADYGTYIELNAKKVHLTDEELYAVVKTGVNFVIGSDAHTPDRVGEISLVEKQLERVDVPRERIANIDGKLPTFRFGAFKGNAGR